jgi:hypothetical protein
VVDDRNDNTPRLGLRPRDAAKALGISERLLWSLTVPRGPIPVARIGVARVYRIADLDAWLAAQTAKAEGGGA